MTTETRLNQLPGMWTVDEEGFRFSYPEGEFVRAIPASKSDPKDKGWVVCSYNVDGTASHANYFPSFRKMVKELTIQWNS